MTSRDEALISPRVLFTRCRLAYPELKELMNEAEMSVPAMEALAAAWRADYLEPVLPIASRPTSLRIRCAMFSVLATYRGVELSEGIARELEAEALFASGSLTRSLLELIALTAYARGTLPTLVDDNAGLDRESLRLLMASRNFADHGLPEHFTISELIEAAAEQFGRDLQSDYGWLSELAHPNSLLMWAADPENRRLGFERPGIAPAYAELLINHCGRGLRALGHNALWLMEWADRNECALTEP